MEDPDGTPGNGDEAAQADYDSARLNGVSSNGDGTYTYKFAKSLPTDFPESETHQLGGQFRRTFPGDGESYVFNLAYRFRPDGRAVTTVRELVATETCNTCHVQLSAHGGIRREVQLCILCHNPGTTDANTGNTVDFAVMVHKIHRGEGLPSVEEGDPYQIVGFGNSVHDYSSVVFPQDVRNCVVCHEGGGEDAKGASQADFHKTMPTLDGCTSCHDRTWFGDQDETPEGFMNHTGGMHANSQLCSQCHTPDLPGVSPISDAHILPTESDEAPGLSLEVTSAGVAGVKQDGATITIDFNVLDGAGNGVEDLGTLASLGATIAYPAPEYEATLRESIAGTSPGTLVSNGGGSYTYTFADTVPMTDETFAVALEGRVRFEFRGETITQGTDSNGQLLFTLDGGTPTPRRQIVSEEKCAVCHREIRAHGEQRTGVSYCVMCHNANQTDIGRRPEEMLPAESVHFKTMIHGIHMGEELESDLTIFGFGGTAHDFTEVRFPAPQQACMVCHVDGSIDLPIASEALSTVITDVDGETILSEKLPERAACISCHDGGLSSVHALLNTDLEARVETCAVCHGPGAAFAVDEVHFLEN